MGGRITCRLTFVVASRNDFPLMQDNGPDWYVVMLKCGACLTDCLAHGLIVAYFARRHHLKR